jgi:hypothetical protein
MLYCCNAEDPIPQGKFVTKPTGGIGDLVGQETSPTNNQRTRKPTISDYNVEHRGSAYKYSDYKDREQEYNLLFDHFILQGGFDAGV